MGFIVADFSNAKVICASINQKIVYSQVEATVVALVEALNWTIYDTVVVEEIL